MSVSRRSVKRHNSALLLKTSAIKSTSLPKTTDNQQQQQQPEQSLTSRRKIESPKIDNILPISTEEEEKSYTARFFNYNTPYGRLFTETEDDISQPSISQPIVTTRFKPKIKKFPPIMRINLNTQQSNELLSTTTHQNSRSSVSITKKSHSNSKNTKNEDSDFEKKIKETKVSNFNTDHDDLKSKLSKILNYADYKTSPNNVQNITITPSYLIPKKPINLLPKSTNREKKTLRNRQILSINDNFGAVTTTNITNKNDSHKDELDKSLDLSDNSTCIMKTDTLDPVSQVSQVISSISGIHSPNLFKDNRHNFLQINESHPVLTNYNLNNNESCCCTKTANLKDRDTNVVSVKDGNDKQTIIIQPNFMLDTGTMCSTELWALKEKRHYLKTMNGKIRVVKHYPNKNTELAGEGLYKPNKIKKRFLLNDKLGRTKGDPTDEIAFLANKNDENIRPLFNKNFFIEELDFSTNANIKYERASNHSKRIPMFDNKDKSHHYSHHPNAFK